MWGERTFQAFREAARQALSDGQIQQALRGATGRFREERVHALQDLPDADGLRDRLKAIRAATLARLAEHLTTFERNATAAGARVHWARDGAEAIAIILALAKERQVRTVAKSKSMTAEEINLNPALEAEGIRTVETDLGEWIVQLAQEHPTHIIAPAIHKTREQVAALFSEVAGEPLPPDNIPALTATARRLLRDVFLTADMGITGVNIAVAETGSIVLVTNEGNGRMVTTLPRVHVAIMGVEKVVPTWEEAAVWLQLLARSATGQPLSIYTSILTGPARAEDPDGPEEMHIIILDNGRSRLVGTEYEEVLQCIRCGACLNVCPVYRKVGGQTYGSPYSGPIGAVVTPLLFGLDRYFALPHASTLCGACLEVCPVRIDLPRMLLSLRRDVAERGLLPARDRKLEQGIAWLMRHPRLYRWVMRGVRLLQRPFVREGTLHLPAPLHFAAGRDVPALAPRSFMELWRATEQQHADGSPSM